MADERKLTRAEKDELADARQAFSLPGLDELAEVLDDVAMGGADDDLLFHVGVWIGDWVAGQTGWVWIHVSFGPGLEAPALVSSDRSLAMLPLQLVGSVADGAPAAELLGLLRRLETGARPSAPPRSFALVAP